MEERTDGKIIIENLNNIGRKEVPKIQTTIEPALVYPLFRGRGISRWRAKPKYKIIIPQDMSRGAGGYAERKMKEQWAYTYQYFKKLESLLRKRSGFKQYFDPEKDPFYAMYNIGPYTMSPYKVVWKGLAIGIKATVVSKWQGRNYSRGKLVIPEHNTMFIACDKVAEAHYLCALLNSKISSLIVISYIAAFYSTHVLDHIAIPKYNPENGTHRQLSQLSQKAHKLAEEDKSDELETLESEIDRAAAQLWDIRDEELADIRQSLEELK